MLSGFKDTDREILLKLENDRDLLNACSTNKYFINLCDDSFFRNRIAYKYPLSLENKPKNINWKQFYLKLVYLIGKMQEDYDFNFLRGDPEKYYSILQEPNIAQQFFYASKYYLKDLLKYLVGRENKIKFNENYKKYIIWAAFGASLGQHEKLLDIYLNSNFLNLSHLNEALAGAASAGDNFLIKKLIEKGANDFNYALYSAGTQGNKYTVILLLKYGCDINEALAGAGHSKLPKEFIDFLIALGANVEEAIQLLEGLPESIDYLRTFL